MKEKYNIKKDISNKFKKSVFKIFCNKYIYINNIIQENFKDF
jgi:hypothetical protein